MVAEYDALLRSPALGVLAYRGASRSRLGLRLGLRLRPAGGLGLFVSLSLGSRSRLDLVSLSVALLIAKLCLDSHTVDVLTDRFRGPVDNAVTVAVHETVLQPEW